MSRARCACVLCTPRGQDSHRQTEEGSADSRIPPPGGAPRGIHMGGSQHGAFPGVRRVVIKGAHPRRVRSRRVPRRRWRRMHVNFGHKRILYVHRARGRHRLLETHRKLDGEDGGGQAGVDMVGDEDKEGCCGQQIVILVEGGCAAVFMTQRSDIHFACRRFMIQERRSA